MLLPDALWRGLDAVGGRERFDLFGEFGNRGFGCLAFNRNRRRKPGLELVAQAGQFGRYPSCANGLPSRTSGFVRSRSVKIHERKRSLMSFCSSRAASVTVGSLLTLSRHRIQ